jgi:hypothetical protein
MHCEGKQAAYKIISKNREKIIFSLITSLILQAAFQGLWGNPRRKRAGQRARSTAASPKFALDIDGNP